VFWKVAAVSCAPTVARMTTFTGHAALTARIEALRTLDSVSFASALSRETGLWLQLVTAASHDRQDASDLACENSQGVGPPQL
jgi:hypothetical protein